VGLTTVTEVAAVDPRLTVAPARNPVPVSVTVVPPVVGPLLGKTLVSVGPLTKVKTLAKLALWPVLLVTVTAAAPAAAAGVTAVICVALTTFTEAAALDPMFTVAPARNPVPVSVTVVPPVVGPLLGKTLVSVGPPTKVKALAKLALWPLLLVTVTAAAPAAPAGVTAVIWVALTTFTKLAAVGPKLTVAPAANPAPASVTVVPPVVGPLLGDTPVIVRPFAKEKALGRLTL
jgi:hypothetical protein